METQEDEKQIGLTPEQRAQQCGAAIDQLLQEYGCMLIARPDWRRRDDGTWSLVTNVVVMPQQGA